MPVYTCELLTVTSKHEACTSSTTVSARSSGLQDYLMHSNNINENVLIILFNLVIILRTETMDVCIGLYNL